MVGAVNEGAVGITVTAFDAGDDPPPLTATTVNEYAEPFVNPVTVYVVADVVVSNNEP